ncbi:MAG: hypothetical protein KHZ98_04595 [Actinomyces sp.]|nr:hypothetical protein [Actinomyces sp.]
MILTGGSIVAERLAGQITLDPFVRSQINPNSYNYRLGSKIKVPILHDNGIVSFEPQELSEEGYVLQPHTLHLGATFELIGSSRYAMSLIGRSSLGRLGLFLQVSANLGHTGSAHHWTLELVAAHPIRIYPGMVVGQVTFWDNAGDIPENHSYFARQQEPTESRFMAGWSTLV